MSLHFNAKKKYDQEMLHSQNADQPMAPRGRDIEQ